MKLKKIAASVAFFIICNAANAQEHSCDKGNLVLAWQIGGAAQLSKEDWGRTLSSVLNDGNFGGVVSPVILGAKNELVRWGTSVCLHSIAEITSKTSGPPNPPKGESALNKATRERQQMEMRKNLLQNERTIRAGIKTFFIESFVHETAEWSSVDLLRSIAIVMSNKCITSGCEIYLLSSLYDTNTRISVEQSDGSDKKLVELGRTYGAYALEGIPENGTRQKATINIHGYLQDPESGVQIIGKRAQGILTFWRSALIAIGNGAIKVEDISFN